MMMKTQCLASLKNLGVPLIDCTGEAELDISRVVRAHNAQCGIEEEKEGVTQKVYFAYGNDTDFIAMANVPYIEFGQIRARGEANEEHQVCMYGLS